MSPNSPLDPQRSGVYRTPADAAALRERVSAAGGAWIVIDLAGVHDKSSLLRSIASMVDFPARFGNNWDAVADLLQDLSWRSGNAYVLRFANAQKARRTLGAEWSTLLEILASSATYWKERARPFVIFVDDSADLPAWQ